LLENNVNTSEKINMPSNEIKMCSVRLNGKGDLHIELLYTTKLYHAVKIASKLLGTEVYEIDEMSTSALQEVANILTGSFFNALSENTGFRVDLSTPTFKEGGLHDLILEPAKEVINPTNDAVITDVVLSGKNSGTEIHMIVIQHPEHARKLIDPALNSSNKSNYEASSNTNLLGGKNSAIDELLSSFDSDVPVTNDSPEINDLINNTIKDSKQCL
jgi:chemotaxis protein CheC